MTFTEIQTDVQSFLGLTIGASSRVTTTMVKEWINQSYRKAQSKLAHANVNYYQGETQEFDVTASTDKYDLSQYNFLTMKRVEIQYNDAEDKVRAEAADINDIWGTLDPDNDPWNQNRPWYAIWEDDLIIKPTPDESSSGWTTDAGSAIKIWFVELQADMSGASDTPALPITYHHILAYEAIAKGFRRMKKHVDAREWETKWTNELTEMIAENTTKDKNKVMSFTITRGPSRKHGMFRP
jgi:hypothetical protein